MDLGSFSKARVVSLMKAKTFILNMIHLAHLQKKSVNAMIDQSLCYI